MLCVHENFRTQQGRNNTFTPIKSMQGEGGITPVAAIKSVPICKCIQMK